MKVTITIGGLKLKVSIELDLKPVFVRGYSRMIKGRQVKVRPHYRRR